MDQVDALFTAIQIKGFVTKCILLTALKPFAFGAAKLDLKKIALEMGNLSYDMNRFKKILYTLCYQNPHHKHNLLENRPISHVILSFLRRYRMLNYVDSFQKRGISNATSLLPLTPLVVRQRSTISLTISENKNGIILRRQSIMIFTPEEQTVQRRQMVHDYLHYLQETQGIPSTVYAWVFDGKKNVSSLIHVSQDTRLLTMTSTRTQCVCVYKNSNKITMIASSCVVKESTNQETSEMGYPIHRVSSGPILDTIWTNDIDTGVVQEKDNEEGCFISHSNGLRNCDIQRVALSHECLIASTAGGELYSWGKQPIERPFPLNMKMTSTQILQTSIRKMQSISPLGFLRLELFRKSHQEFVKECSVLLTKEDEDDTSMQEKIDKRWDVSIGKMGPRRIPSISNTIIQLACGSHFAIALDSTGCVYSWGSDIMGSLGHGLSTLDYIEEPTLLDSITNNIVVSIACGDYHTLAQLENGHVFVWGDNAYGQCGIKDSSCLVTPVQITSFESVCILAIACGARHSLFLTEELGVWATGCNWHGQLGFTNECDIVYTPVHIPFFERQDVCCIAASGNTSTAATISGELFVWGKCCPSADAPAYGRLDHPTPQKVKYRDHLLQKITNSDAVNIIRMSVSDGCILFATRN